MRVTAIFAALAGALLVLNADAASVDNELTRAVKEALPSNIFSIVIKDEGSQNGRKHRKPETVTTIELPGTYLFTLKIDRNEGQVIVIIKRKDNTETEYFNVKSLSNTSSSNTLVLIVDQRKPGASITLHVNCEQFGTLHMLHTLREEYYDMTDPHVLMTHEKRFNVQVKVEIDWVLALRALNCTVDDSLYVEQMPAMQPAQPAVTEIGIRMPSIGRGDIPINHDCDDLFFVKTIQELVQMVKKLREDVESQRLEIYKLRQLLEQCDDFCRPGMRNP